MAVTSKPARASRPLPHLSFSRRNAGGLVALFAAGLLLCLSGCVTTRKAATTTEDDLALEPSAKSAAEARASWGAGWLALRNRDPVRALEHFERAAQLDPANLTTVRAVVEQYLQQKRFAAATELLERALAERPETFDLWTILAGAQLSAQNTSGAAIAVRKAATVGERTKSEDATVWLNLGKVASTTIHDRPPIRMLAPKEALLAYQRLIKLDPTNVEYKGKLAQFHAYSGKYADALKEWRAIAALTPEVEQQLEGLIVGTARLLPALDRKQFASALEKVTRQDPSLLYFVVAIGRIHSEDGRVDLALNYLEAAEKQIGTLSRARQAQFFSTYAMVYERAGKLDDAEQKYRRSLALSQADEKARALASNNLGYMLADANRKLDEALELIQNAIKIDPENAAYVDSLGWIYFRLGRNEEALKELQRAMKLFEAEARIENRKLTAEDAVLFDHLAQVHAKLGQKDEAVRAWQRAVELDPKNKDYAARLREARTGQPPSPPTGRASSAP